MRNKTKLAHSYFTFVVILWACTCVKSLIGSRQLWERYIGPAFWQIGWSNGQYEWFSFTQLPHLNSLLLYLTI